MTAPSGFDMIELELSLDGRHIASAGQSEREVRSTVDDTFADSP